MRHEPEVLGRSPALTALLFLALALWATPARAQDTAAVHWQRHEGPTEAPLTVFHSTQSANLPTAATRDKGELIFEISHRFEPPFSQGQSALWGLDGPIWNRLGLSYALTDRVLLGVRRTNLQDNLDVRAKVRFLEGGRDVIPFQVAAVGGVAWNTQVPQDAGYQNNEMQAYAQLVANASLGPKVAVGVVPTFLHNPRIADANVSNEFVLGMNGQLWLNHDLSLLAEWVAAPARQGLEYDPVTFGFQIETGGHFFKLLATNSVRPNPTQFLAGTPNPLSLHELRFGFNVTRLLSF
jgi:hypothetical protein